MGLFSSIQARIRAHFFSRPVIGRRISIISIIGIIIVVLLTSFFGSKIFVSGLLYLIGSFSMVYKRGVKGLPIGLEFVTLTTVVMSIAHGPIVGAFFGVFTAISAQVVANDYDPGAIFFFFGEFIVGLTAGLIPLPSIVVIAIASITIFVFSQFVAIIGSIEQKFSAGIYLVTHLIINVGLWQYVGTALLAFASA